MDKKNYYTVLAIECGEVVDFVENIRSKDEANIIYTEFKKNFADCMTVQLLKNMGYGKRKIIKNSNRNSMFCDN